jgi:hypothetical protein
MGTAANSFQKRIAQASEHCDWHDKVAAFVPVENSMVAGARYINFRSRRALRRAA